MKPSPSNTSVGSLLGDGQQPLVVTPETELGDNEIGSWSASTRASSPSAGRAPSRSPSSVPHDIAIEGNGVDVAGNIVMDRGTSTVTATLKPGTYTFLCTVDSHAEDGMEGTLTVR